MCCGSKRLGNSSLQICPICLLCNTVPRKTVEMSTCCPHSAAGEREIFLLGSRKKSQEKSLREKKNADGGRLGEGVEVG